MVCWSPCKQRDQGYFLASCCDLSSGGWGLRAYFLTNFSFVTVLVRFIFRIFFLPRNHSALRHHWDLPGGKEEFLYRLPLPPSIYPGEMGACSEPLVLIHSSLPLYPSGLRHTPSVSSPPSSAGLCLVSMESQDCSSWLQPWEEKGAQVAASSTSSMHGHIYCEKTQVKVSGSCA